MWLNAINLGSGDEESDQSSIPEGSSNHNKDWKMPRWGLWERLLNIQASTRHIFTHLWLANTNIIQHVAILAVFTEKYLDPKVLAAEPLIIEPAYNSVGSSPHLDFTLWS